MLCAPTYLWVLVIQYLDLLSEHEDLLQLLAQQEVVKNKLFNALEVRLRGGGEGGLFWQGKHVRSGFP